MKSFILGAQPYACFYLAFLTADRAFSSSAAAAFIVPAIFFGIGIRQSFDIALSAREQRSGATKPV